MRLAGCVGIFPNDASITRLVGAMMLEQNDEWSLNRRYMQLEALSAQLFTALELTNGHIPWAAIGARGSVGQTLKALVFEALQPRVGGAPADTSGLARVATVQS